MEDLNKQLRIEDSPSMEKSNYRLRKTAFLGFLLCALPLILPPFVVLSAFVVAFSIPFGFVFAIYLAIRDLMSSLICKQPIPFYSEYENVSGYDLGKLEDNYAEEMAKEEGYEQDYDLEEEVELGTTVIGHQLGVTEASIDVEEVIVDEVKEVIVDEVKEDGNETEESGTTLVRFNSVERQKLGKEKKDEDENEVPLKPSLSPFLSWGGSGDYGNLEQLLGPPEVETPDDEAAVLEEDSEPVEEQSGNVEPGELIKGMEQMLEVVRNEGKFDIDNLQESMEEATSILDLEHVKLLSIDSRVEAIDDTCRLQTIEEQLAAKKEKKKKRREVMTLEIEHTTDTSTTTEVIPRKGDQLVSFGDIDSVEDGKLNAKKFEGTGTENHTACMMVNRGEGI